MGGYQGDFDGAATYSGIMYGEEMRGIRKSRNRQPRDPEGKIETVARLQLLKKFEKRKNRRLEPL